MRITRHQLKRLIREAVGDDLPGGPFEFTKPDDISDVDDLPGMTPSSPRTAVEFYKQNEARIDDFIDSIGPWVRDKDVINILIGLLHDEANPEPEEEPYDIDKETRHVDAMGKPFSGPGSAPGDFGPLHPEYKKK